MRNIEVFGNVLFILKKIDIFKNCWIIKIVINCSAVRCILRKVYFASSYTKMQKMLESHEHSKCSKAALKSPRNVNCCKKFILEKWNYLPLSRLGYSVIIECPFYRMRFLEDRNKYFISSMIFYFLITGLSFRILNMLLALILKISIATQRAMMYTAYDSNNDNNNNNNFPCHYKTICKNFPFNLSMWMLSSRNLFIFSIQPLYNQYNA